MGSWIGTTEWCGVEGLYVPPQAHAVPHHALDHAHIVCPPRHVVRYSLQCALAWAPIRSHRHACLVIRYLLAGPLQQLRVYRGRQRPRRTARGRGLVRWELETDEHAVGREELRDVFSPLRAQGQWECAEKLSMSAYEVNPLQPSGSSSPCCRI
jgi:hypothetical protein